MKMVAVSLLICCLVAYSTAALTENDFEDFKTELGGDYDNRLFRYNAKTQRYSHVFADIYIPSIMFSRLNGERDILANGCDDLSKCKVQNISKHSKTVRATYSSMLRDDSAMAYDAKDSAGGDCVQFAAIGDYLVERSYDCPSGNIRATTLLAFADAVKELRSNL